MYRDAAPVTPVPSNLEIRAIRPDEADAWAAVAVDLLGVPDDAGGGLARFMGAIIGFPGPTAYGALAGTHVGAPGALADRAGIDPCSRAFTYPQYRQQGAQSGLLAARLQDAIAAGCRVMSVETWPHTAEKNNPSLSNLMRAGFQVRYERRSWTWEA